MIQDLVGKSGLIVSGTSGVGKAVARLLLQRGAMSVTVLGKNAAKLRSAEDELGSFGNVIACNADITDGVQLARLMEESGGKFAKMDLLVNAAGVFIPKPYLEQTMEDYDRYLELNKGIFLITQHVARGMVERLAVEPLSTSGRCGPNEQLAQRHLLPIRWPKQASIH